MFRELERHEGFTLVELSAVIVVLGIIILVAVANYANTSKGIAIKGAQRQVETALNRAVTAARQENVTYRVIFYPQSDAAHPNTYEFLHNVENDGDWSMQPIDGSVSGEGVTIDGGHYYIGISNGVSIAGENNITIDISPAGTELNVTPVTINLQLGDSSSGVVISSQGLVSFQ